MKVSWGFGCAALMMMATAGGAVAGKDKAPAAHERASNTRPEPAGGKAAVPDTKAGAAAAEATNAEADGPGGAAEPSVPHIVGPKLVDLGHHAQIDLPAGMVLFEQAAAQEILRKSGSSTEDVVAAIAPMSDAATWLVVIEADDVGYVSDDDAGDLDAGEMLDQFKAGTLEQNKKRVELGVTELFVDGWSEPPRYERANRHLVWGLNGHTNDGKVVNFFTRFLGRNGYLSVDLIDESSKIAGSKAEALSILTAVHFTPGFRYEDHIGSDHDSGLGLKALVLGGAGVVIAKKTGILIAILLVLKKGFIVVAAAIGGFFKWLFGRRKRDAADATLMVSDVPLVAPPPPSDPPSDPPSNPGEPPVG